MAFVAITTAEADAKSPMDDTLWGKVKDNFDDLNSRVVTAGNSPFVWEIHGKLATIRNFKRSIAFGLVNKEFTPSICRFMLKKSGTSGTLSFDIRKHTAPLTPITGIDYQFSDSTLSVARVSGASTQSIARSTAQISTQSISFAKAAANVTSIIQVIGTNLWRYNLDSTPDADWVIGKSVTFASCTTPANNGTFVIVEVNQSGYPSVVVTNASGVAQTSAAGTCQLKLMSYNFTNPVSSEFAAGESALFASHSDAANDGTLPVYAVNSGGNNLLVFNASGVAQGGAAGNTNVLRWKFAFSALASTTNFVVGEKAHMTTHTSGGNNGDFTITAVNLGGNNVTVYNTAGVAQGGAAGATDTNRWKYSLTNDPSAQITAGDTVRLSSHTSSNNDGTFTVKEVNNSAGTNVVVYNTSGVAQVGAAGLTATTKKLVKFLSDQSAVYTTDSYIEMQGCASGLYNFAGGREPFRVLQVNRGGGANFNVVIDAPTASSQASPAGLVAVEMKSIFTVAPSLSASVTALSANENIKGTSTDIAATVIDAQTPLMLYLTSVMSGDPQDLTVSIA